MTYSPRAGAPVATPRGARPAVPLVRSGSSSRPAAFSVAVSPSARSARVSSSPLDNGHSISGAVEPTSNSPGPSLTKVDSSKRATLAEAWQPLPDPLQRLKDDSSSAKQQLESLAEACAALESRIAQLSTNLAEEKIARVEEVAKVSAMVQEIRCSVSEERSERQAVLEELRENMAADLSEAVRLAVAEATKQAKEEIGRQMALRKTRSVTWGDEISEPVRARTSAPSESPSCLKEESRLSRRSAVSQVSIVEFETPGGEDLEEENNEVAPSQRPSASDGRDSPDLPQERSQQHRRCVEANGSLDMSQYVPAEPEPAEHARVSQDARSERGSESEQRPARRRHQTRKEQLENIYDALADSNWRDRIASDVSEFYSIYEDRGRTNTEGQLLVPRRSAFVGQGTADAEDEQDDGEADANPS